MILTQEQIARLEQLKSKPNLTISEKAELDFLASAEPEKDDKPSKYYQIMFDKNDEVKQSIREGDFQKVRDTVCRTALDIAHYFGSLAKKENFKSGLHLMEQMTDININNFAEQVLPTAEETPVQLKIFSKLIQNDDSTDIDVVHFREWYSDAEVQVAEKTLKLLDDVPPYFAAPLIQIATLLALDDVIREQRNAFPEYVQTVLPEEYTVDEYRIALGILSGGAQHLLRWMVSMWNGMYSGNYTKFGTYQELSELSEKFLTDIGTEVKNLKQAKQEAASKVAELLKAIITEAMEGSKDS
jgi:hypothetical protein|uniref:Uncharacterized protein n=1 Tax=Podoviridae sp. ctBev14 TaxID=2823556 RepID=A0A8S5LAV4_9CAUD|nr:MAG TPA: hypothetical protein [Podoviridae sp. ctBev14]